MFKFRDNYLKEDNTINISKTDSENYFILLKNFKLPSKYKLPEIIFAADSQSLYYNLVVTNNKYNEDLDEHDKSDLYYYENFKIIRTQNVREWCHGKFEISHTNKKLVRHVKINDEQYFNDLIYMYNKDIDSYYYDTGKYNIKIKPYFDKYQSKVWFNNWSKVIKGIDNDNIKLLELPPLNNNNDTIVLYYITEKNDKIDIENYLKKFKLPEINEEILLELE